MSRKTQHTCFEDKILGKLANEDKPQVVTPCSMVVSIENPTGLLGRGGGSPRPTTVAYKGAFFLQPSLISISLFRRLDSKVDTNQRNFDNAVNR